MRIMFMGTPEFALFSLKALCDSGEDIIAVVTQPDKPKGRGYTLTPPPVKVFAEEKGIAVYQPQTLRSQEFADLLAQLAPELIVVVAYGRILPTNVLEYPKYGCINVHGSLLPEYRGAAPMQRAIIDGRSETGITTMYMAQGLDTGDMLLSEKITIEKSDNFETVHDRLGVCGASVLLKTIEGIRNGTLRGTPQDESKATYAKKIEKSDCVLDFSKDAATLHNLIRGLSPFPLAFTHTPDGRLLKVISSEVYENDRKIEGEAGQVISLDGSKITVACGNGSAVSLLSVLPEGKGRMSASDFIRGRKINVGDILR